MKTKKRMTKLLVTSGLSFLATLMVTGGISTSLSSKKADQVVAQTYESSANWYDLHADDENKSIDLYLSPLPQDYRSLNKTDAKELGNELIDAVKNIFAKQISFIKEVPQTDPREVDLDLTPDDSAPIRKTVLDALVNGVLLDEEGEVIHSKVEEFDGSVNSDVPPTSLESTGLFLRTSLSYLAAYGINGGLDSSKISTRLGIGVGEGGNVIVSESSALYDSLSSIYTSFGVEPSEIEEKITKDIQCIYDDAMEISVNDANKTMAVVKILDAMEETNIPTETVISILGAENTLNSIMSLFTDENVGVNYGSYFLNEIDNMTMGEICDAINEQKEGGFTRDDIKNAFNAASNSRLMEIASSLDANGLNNIRVIIGKPVDYDPEDQNRLLKAGPKMLKAAPAHASASEYAKFSEKLVEIIMERISINDLLQGTRRVSIEYKGVTYDLVKKPLVSEGVYGENLQLQTHELVDFLNALPKMEEVKRMANGTMVLDMKLIVDTVFNEATPDAEGKGGPLEINVNFGFQNKDSSYIRRAAEKLDEYFDLVFDFKDNGEFYVKLNTRVPLAAGNIFGWICDSDFIPNKEMLVELWDLLFSSPEQIANYIKEKEIEDVVSMLKDVNYEEAFATFTTAEALNELFEVGIFTEARLDRAVNGFKKLLSKAVTLTYDDVLGYIESIFGGRVANIIDKDIVERVYNKVLALAKKVDAKDVSIEMLRDITNEGVYEYIDKLLGKEDLFIRAKNLVLKVLNKVPARFKDNTLMDLYVGNGEFALEGTADIPYERVIKALPKGDKLWVVFDGMVVGEQRPQTLHVDLDVKFNNLHSVQYEWVEGEETHSKVGMLHEGSDLKLFSGRDSVEGKSIVHWVEKDDVTNRIDTMPNEDIIIVPEYLYTVEISESINKEYDGEGFLTVTPAAEFDYEFTYQWQKYDEDLEDFVDVEGETTDTIDTVNVSDSGKYRCVVNNGDQEVISGEATVNITPVEVDLSVCEWIDENEFEYDGQAKTVTLKEDTIPTGVDVSYETKQKDATTYGEATRVDLGEYVTQAVITPISENYVIKEGTEPLPQEWYIFKVVDLSRLEWSSHSSFVYDSDGHSVTVKYYDTVPEIDSITYETTPTGGSAEDGNEMTDVGEYVTTATINYKEGYNEHTIHVINDNITNNPKVWEITQGIIDIKGVRWNYVEPFVFDKEAHTVDLVSNALPEQVEYKFMTSSINEATHAGHYVAKVQLSIKDEYKKNYKFSDDSVLEYSLSWVIEPKHIAPTNPVWSLENETLVYDGTAKEFYVENVDNMKLMNVQYIDNYAIDAGEYEAYAYFTLKEQYQNDYILDNPLISHTYVINKAQISVENVVWNYDSTNPYTEDGTEHSVYVTSYTNGEFVEITYVDDGTYVDSASVAGEFEAMAQFSLKEEYSNNYELTGDLTSILSWQINQRDIQLNYQFVSEADLDEDGNNNLFVTLQTGIEEKPELRAKLSAGEEFRNANIDYDELLGEKGEVKFSYNVYFENEGEKFDIQNNALTYKILVPKEIRDEDYVIIVLNEDDSVTKVEASMSEDGKYATFAVNSAKNVGFITKAPHSQDIKDNKQVLAIVGTIGLSQILIVIAVIAVAKKIKKSREN